MVAGRPVFCYAQDRTFAGGSLGEAHADTIVRVLRLARRAGAPVVGFVESGGARMDEGTASLAGYGRIFREHVAAASIPQISVITGTAAGGASYSPALTDFVVMTEEAAMFLTGPRDRGGGHGRAREHWRSSAGPRSTPAAASASSSPDRRRAPWSSSRELLAHLPQSTAEAPPIGDSRARPAAAIPGGRPGRAAPRLRRPRRRRAHRRPRPAARDRPALGPQHGHGLRPRRRPRGRRDRQPAALPRRDDRPPCRPQGRPLRQHLRPVRRAAAGPLRHARIPARARGRRHRA